MLLFGLEAITPDRPFPIKSKSIPFVSSITKITNSTPNMHTPVVIMRHPYSPIVSLRMGKYKLTKKEDIFIERV